MISAASLVEWLNAEAEDETLIGSLRDAAVAYINEPGGKYFGAVATITDRLNWGGGTFLLSNEPIDGTYTVTEWDGSAWAAVDTSNYVLDGRLIYADESTLTFTTRTTPRRFRIEYQAGYTLNADGETLDDAPEDVKQAVRMIVADWYRNREGKAENRVSAEINVAVDAILRRHR